LAKKKKIKTKGMEGRLLLEYELRMSIKNLAKEGNDNSRKN